MSIVKLPRRFYLERHTDVTGVSATGRVLEAVLWPSGEVSTQWRPPLQSMGFYHSLNEFLKIHVECHPDANTVRWIDSHDSWHCFDCGANGMQGNFCERCGSPSTGHNSAFEGFKRTERYELEREIDALNSRKAELIDRLTRLGDGMPQEPDTTKQ